MSDYSSGAILTPIGLTQELFLDFDQRPESGSETNISFILRLQGELDITMH